MSNRKTESLQRLLGVAAKMFLAHRYEDVSMAAIARAARCSTATMYEVFHNKEGLFMAALGACLETPPVVWDREHSSFRTLLDYACARIAITSSPEIHAMLRTVVRQPELTGKAFVDSVADNRLQNDLALDTLIGAALAEGMLRPLERQVFQDIFNAMTHEPVLQTLLMHRHQIASTRRILRNLFTPLVTPAGFELLSQYLAQHFPPLEPPPSA